MNKQVTKCKNSCKIWLWDWMKPETVTIYPGIIITYSNAFIRLSSVKV